MPGYVELPAMGYQNRFGLKGIDRQRLQQALSQQPTARTFRRLRAVLMLAEGTSPELAAEALGVSIASVYRWLQRYQQRHQPGDLLDLPRSGRPSVTGPVADQQIEQLLRTTPLDVGYQSTGWTVELVRHELHERFGCLASDATVRRRLRQMGYRWNRPRYVYTEQDRHRAQKKGVSGGP